MTKLDLLRKLNDVEMNNRQLSDQYLPMIREKKAQGIEAAVDAFNRFFHQRAYQVRTDVGRVTASLDNTHTVSMTIPSPEESFVGAYSVFHLTSRGGGRSYQFIVIMNPDGSYPRVSVSSYPAPRNEEEELAQKIKDSEARTQDLMRRIEGIEAEVLTYGLVQGDKSNIHNYPTFKDLRELLAAALS